MEKALISGICLLLLFSTATAQPSSDLVISGLEFELYLDYMRAGNKAVDRWRYSDAWYNFRQAEALAESWSQGPLARDCLYQARKWMLDLSSALGDSITAASFCAKTLPHIKQLYGSPADTVNYNPIIVLVGMQRFAKIYRGAGWIKQAQILEAEANILESLPSVIEYRARKQEEARQKKHKAAKERREAAQERRKKEEAEQEKQRVAEEQNRVKRRYEMEEEWTRFKNDCYSQEEAVTTWQIQVKQIKHGVPRGYAHNRLGVEDQERDPVIITSPFSAFPTYKAASSIHPDFPNIKKKDWIIVKGKFMGMSPDGAVILQPIRVQNLSAEERSK